MSHTGGQIGKKLAALHEHVAAQQSAEHAAVDAAHEELLAELKEREDATQSASAPSGIA